MNDYLKASDIIDWDTPDVKALADSLAAHTYAHKRSDKAIAKRCFEWVRDNIKHSVDYQQSPVTCKASDVLKFGTGYCYAKSHLLAALLRANNIPAGLCYQRLSINDNGAPYSLHGLNAIYLAQYGWYRVDPRGNKAGINAQFIPPQEQLAFALNDEDAGEANLDKIYSEPLALVINTLETYTTLEEVQANLPDIKL